MNPFQAAQEIAEAIGFDLTKVETHISQQSDYDRNVSLMNVCFTLRHDALSAKQRQAIKRMAELRVPDWALELREKPLEGKASYCAAEGTEPEVRVEFYVTGAFVCTAVGTEEVEPDEYNRKRAERLLALSPEQALQAMQDEAAALLKPQTRTRYHCEAK